MNSYHSSQRQGSARPYSKFTTHGEKFGFKRSLLPTTQQYFTQIAPLELKGGGDWRDAICPFHDDKSPSLRVNIEKGCFACMACGTKGGDVLAFHMKLRGFSFIAAAKDLGAWEGGK
jgi:CHC2 zinc finger